MFHNLRSSRQTELAEKYPIHVVCAWIGNSRAVAHEHYLQVTDAHFKHASEAGSDQKEQAAQKAAQSAAAHVGNQQEFTEPSIEDRSDLPSDTHTSRYLHIEQLGAVGFEPTKA